MKSRIVNNTKEANKIAKINSEIMQLLMQINDKYPSVFRNLLETPYVNSETGKNQNINDLSEYLNTIKTLITTNSLK
jgi:hypothetical protein